MYKTTSSMHLNVLINGRNATLYPHKEDLYIESRRGTVFEIKVTNPYGSRAAVIISVDGISVIDGKPAGEHSSGYILAPYETKVVSGWRVSDTAIREFAFTMKDEGYATAVDQTENIGVIGVMFVKEAPLPPPPSVNWNPMWSSGQPRSVLRSSKSIGVACASVGDDHSVGQGDYQTSHVRTVSFQPSNEKTVRAIRYDSWKNLVNNGIVRKVERNPNPFPGSPSRYCESI